MKNGTETLETYTTLMTMNGAAHAYAAALSTGIINTIVEEPRTAHDIVRICGTVEHATVLLLDALCAMNVLVKDGERYGPAPILGMLNGQQRMLGNDHWAHLPAFLHTGKLARHAGDAGMAAQEHELSSAALEWLMAPVAQEVAALIGIGARMRECAILDIGSGAAVWSITCAKLDTAAHVTAVDWPAMLVAATEAARAAGVSDRFTAMPGNYETIEFGVSTYDLAVAANIIHRETPETCRSLFSRVLAALKPGGTLAIIDVFSGQEAGELTRAISALELALHAGHGGYKRSEDVIHCLGECGFVEAAYKPVRLPPYTMGAVLAARPA